MSLSRNIWLKTILSYYSFICQWAGSESNEVTHFYSYQQQTNNQLSRLVILISRRMETERAAFGPILDSLGVGIYPIIIYDDKYCKFDLSSL